MGQEFFVKSDNLESKVRQLLPSQGGLGAGFDLSASTQIIPIVDLTESAEGSDVRADLQTAFSHSTITSFSVTNTTTDIISNTGYYRVFGSVLANGSSTGTISLRDSSTSKAIDTFGFGGGTFPLVVPFDFIVFLTAGDVVRVFSSGANMVITGNTRQIADIDGNLINP